MSSARFAFGPFVFDSQRQLLFEQGRPVGLGQRALALLGALLAARGDVVLKSELMDVAWPGLYVEESNLTVQVAALRRRLGPAGAGEWIETLSRVGYRFAGAFSLVEPGGSMAPGPRQHAVPPPAPDSALRNYELYIRARSLMLQSPEDNNLARRYLQHVLLQDATLAPAHACLAISYFGDALYFSRDAEANRAAGAVHAQTAIALNPEDATARWASGFVKLYSGRADEAASDWEIALALAPDQPEVLAKMGDLHVQDGDAAGGIALAERAIERNPHALGCAYWDLGFAYYAGGRYEDAVRALGLPEVERLPARRIRAAALAQLGRQEEAREEARRFLVSSPGFSIAEWAATQRFRQRADLEHFVDGYALAGLPR